MSTYDYKGIAIGLRVGVGDFTAKVNTQTLSAPSLPAMRKKIDAALAIKFEAFDVLTYNTEKYSTRKAIGLQKGSHSWHHGHMLFVLDTVIDRPANRNKITFYQKTFKTNKAIIAKLEAEIEKAEDAIPHVKADDYAVKGKK